MPDPAFRRLALLIPALALAGGCAARGHFPSLAPRPAERLSMDEPDRQAAAVAADPRLAARIAALLADARRGQAEFETVLPGARSGAGAAGAAGSESWIEAQKAISRLEAARALTVAALAQLDELGVERAALPTSAEQLATLLAAMQSAEALAAGQQGEIDGLRASLDAV
jgi:hypothetical protein